jgi:hypothetical protein
MGGRAVGLGLLNVAGVLVIGGALYDLLVPTLPANHLAYLGTAEGQLDPRYAELDLALLRALGGCLLAVGVTALVLANGPVRRGERWARVALSGEVAYGMGGRGSSRIPERKLLRYPDIDNFHRRATQGTTGSWSTAWASCSWTRSRT